MGTFSSLTTRACFVSLTISDEIIDQINVETGYNYRGVERLCIGKKVSEALEMLERLSSVNGFSIGLAFLHAVEKINNVNVPERANFLRLIFNELSF